MSDRQALNQRLQTLNCRSRLSRTYRPATGLAAPAKSMVHPLLLLVWYSATAFCEWTPELWTAGEYAEEGFAIPYQLFVPADTSEPLPLVTFLHGNGGFGSDNERQMSYQAATMWETPEMQDNWPCFALAPQGAAGKWVDVDYGIGTYAMRETPTRSMQLVMSLIDMVSERYPIDPSRVYLMGSSAGGYGAWELAIRKPTTFAAVIPIMGGADSSKASLVAHVAFWAFHHDDDPVVPVSGTRNMIEALRKAGGEPCYTEYKGSKHGGTSAMAFAEPELFPWLFRQSKRALDPVTRVPDGCMPTDGAMPPGGRRCISLLQRELDGKARAYSLRGAVMPSPGARRHVLNRPCSVRGNVVVLVK
jgi:poly(3-hydroxybutyrate) depolymerase